MKESVLSLLWICGLCLVASVGMAGEFPLDVKPLALTVYGVRGAYAVDAQTVRVVLGASVGDGRAQAEAWRICSEEDARYAYEKFVRPAAARSVEEREEFAFPEGFQEAEICTVPLRRHVIELRMPEALRPGCRYGLVAQGNGGAIVTAARSGAEFVYEVGAGVPELEADRMAAQTVGLRRVGSVGDGFIVLEFGAGYSSVGGMVGTNYRVRVNGQERAVCGLGRRSRLDAYWCGGWPYRALRLHDVFLDVGASLNEGDRVEIAVAESVTAGQRTGGFVLDSSKAISRSIQVNQVGYLPERAKVGYVSCWLGSYPDASAQGLATAAVETHSAEYERLAPTSLRLEEAPAFEVVDAVTDAVVWRGRGALRASGLDVDRDPQMGIRRRLSSSNVYELDFGAFQVPGQYYLRIPGVGRSYAFRIGVDVYVEAFRKQSTGVFAQRCGFALEPNDADGWRRIACHAKGILASTIDRWTVHEFAPFAEHLEMQAGADGVPVPRVLQARGGHHDAGDYNPRSHMDVAQQLFNAYELAPEKFSDGQLGMPEAGNGIPDIVDEGLWAVHLWEGLQDEDGGVYDGTESAGDPFLTQSVELDDKGDYAFAKGSRGSFVAAGVFAQASRILQRLGKTERAAELLVRARRAYAWGKAHRPEIEDARMFDEFFTAPYAYAAAELYHTTREEAFHEDFRRETQWAHNEWAELRVDGKYEHTQAGLAYLLIPRESADPVIWDRVLAALKREVELYIRCCSQRDYPFITHPYVSIFWGFGAYQHFLMTTVHLWRHTGEARYLDWIVRTCDNTLGANPLNLSWVVGLGQQTVRAPLHNSHYRPAGFVVTGMQAEGPCAQFGFTSFSYRESVYPEHRDDLASMSSFADAHFCIEMDEGVIRNQVETMAVFGLLCPDIK